MSEKSFRMHLGQMRRVTKLSCRESIANGPALTFVLGVTETKVQSFLPSSNGYPIWPSLLITLKFTSYLTPMKGNQSSTYLTRTYRLVHEGYVYM